MDEQQLQQQIVQLVQAAMQGDKQATQQIQQIMQAAQQGDQQAAQLAQMIQEVAQQMQQQQVQAAKFGAKLNYIQHLKGVCPEGYEMQLFKQGGQICKKCIQKAKMQNGGDIPDDDPIEAFKKKHQLKARMDKIAQSGKYDKFIPSKPKNVIEGSVRSGKSNFDPNNTTLPSRNADGMQTPNRLQRSGKGSNNILIPKKPIKRDKCGSKVEMDKCGKKMKKKACGGSVKKDQKGGTVKAVRTVTTYPNKLENQQRTVQYFDDGTQAVFNGGWGTDGRFRATLRGRRGEFGNTAGTPRQQQIADSLERGDWRQLGWGPIQVPALKKTSRTK